MELYYEHPAITSGGICLWIGCALGTMANQIKSFQFLLRQADQGDLDKAKEAYDV